jgi:hypothetical protein
MPSQREQYGSTVHLFIDAGHSPRKITSMSITFLNDSWKSVKVHVVFSSLSRFPPLLSRRSFPAHSFGCAPPFAELRPSSGSGFVLTVLHVHDSEFEGTCSHNPLGKHCQIMFLRTFGGRRPPTSTLEVATAENLDLKDDADTCPAPEDVAGDDLTRVGSVSHCPAPKGAAGDDPAQVGSANYDPAPEGARVGSPSCTSMDIHAGSPPHSGCMVVAQTLDQGVALEGSVPADRVLGSVEGAELISAGSLQAASGGGLTPAYQLISPDLGIPSFFSNLQVL